MPHLLISGPPQYYHTLFTYDSNSQQTTPSSLLKPHPQPYLCHTPSTSDSTPVLSTVYHIFSPLIPHCHYLHHTHFNSDPAHNSTYATPSSFVALPQYYLYHGFFFHDIPHHTFFTSICWYCKSFKNALVFFYYLLIYFYHATES